MSKYFWTIDEGHGGVDPEGNYSTPAFKGKEYHFDNGPKIFEGEVNRKIGSLLKDMLCDAGISYDSVNHPLIDTPLSQRVNKIDTIFHRERKQGRTAILISIHSNALTKPEEICGEGQNKARNFTIWTSIGQTKSDQLVQFFERSYKDTIPEYKFATDKSDGDSDFEADFYILRKSDGPAILVENLFFDNIDNAEFLLSFEGQKKIAKAIFDGIVSCEKIEPI